MDSMVVETMDLEVVTLLLPMEEMDSTEVSTDVQMALEETVEDPAMVLEMDFLLDTAHLA